MSRKATYAPEQIGVKTLATSALYPNPHNPRMLFDRQPLNILKESIQKAGILVPLTVYFDARRKRYIILDGQRRWMCAQELGLDEVPVNQVAEPTLVQNIVTMFQIHKFREDWELMPTALKVEVLMKEMKERNDRKLAALTGLDQAVVVRCKKLLDYPKKYQDMMLEPDPADRVKADFFIELYVVRNDRFVGSFKWFHKDEFTQAMLDRYLNKRLKAVTDFRLMKQHINNARKAKQAKLISKRLQEFVDDEELGLEHLELGPATALASAKAVERRVVGLLEDLKGLDIQACYGEDSLWETLEELLKVIRSRLNEVGWRTSP